MPRIKGSHAAIKTGMLAAESIAAALGAGRERDELPEYEEAFNNSWLKAELWKARNFKQWFKKGRNIATLMTGIEQSYWAAKCRGRFIAPKLTMSAYCLLHSARRLSILNQTIF